jgi:hypothetical protein
MIVLIIKNKINRAQCHSSDFEFYHYIKDDSEIKIQFEKKILKKYLIDCELIFLKVLFVILCFFHRSNTAFLSSLKIF